MAPGRSCRPPAKLWSSVAPPKRRSAYEVTEACRAATQRDIPGRARDNVKKKSTVLLVTACASRQQARIRRGVSASFLERLADRLWNST